MTVILNQGAGGRQGGECAGFALLTALIRIKPDTDHVKIARELIEEDGNSFTLQRASAWFVRKGYIKGIEKTLYIPNRIKREPVIGCLKSVDWISTGKPPYNLTFGPPRITGHWICIDSPGRCANTWTDRWGDHGYFYFTQSQVKKFGPLWRIKL